MSFLRPSGFPSGPRWTGKSHHSSGDSPRICSPRICKHGASCIKFGCTFIHPPSRPKDCPDAERCNELACLLHHPIGRSVVASSLRTCKHGASCVKFGCTFTHPPSRPMDCPDGEQCDEMKCPLHHPRSWSIMSQKPCDYGFGTRCTNTGVVEAKETHSSSLSLADFDPKTNQTPPGFDSDSTQTPPGFEPIVPRAPLRPRTLRMRVLDRVIVRSPMMEPSPGSRPTTGFFAATTKRCSNGASCHKYGCTYKHPASRATDCPLGLRCAVADCVQLHPLNVNDMDFFAVGQTVEARFLASSSKWSNAVIRHICGSVLRVQFSGYDDIVDVPMQRVRHPGNVSPQHPHTLGLSNDKSQADGGYASAPPAAPPSPTSLSDVAQLERLKLDAVAREDYLAADQIKHRIAKVKKVAALQQRKQMAVREEDYILALEIKQQIDALDPVPVAAPSRRRHNSCASELAEKQDQSPSWASDIVLC